MGSDSDMDVMEAAAKILKKFNIGYEITIVSAHRTPARMVEYATVARQKGLKIIIVCLLFPIFNMLAQRQAAIHKKYEERGKLIMF